MSSECWNIQGKLTGPGTWELKLATLLTRYHITATTFAACSLIFKSSNPIFPGSSGLLTS